MFYGWDAINAFLWCVVIVGSLSRPLTRTDPWWKPGIIYPPRKGHMQAALWDTDHVAMVPIHHIIVGLLPVEADDKGKNSLPQPINTHSGQKRPDNIDDMICRYKHN